jgi:hypothetical protein
MKKDETIGVRVAADLKQSLNRIAAIEGRSLAQVCEIFLRAGISEYGKQGTKFLQRFATKHKAE